MVARLDWEGLAASQAAVWLAALEQLRGAFTDKTICDYAKSFLTFERWCESVGRVALPAEPATVVSFIDACAGRCTAGTIDQHVYAIKRVHLNLGLPDVSKAPTVRIARRRCRRLRRRHPQQALGLTREMRDLLRLSCRPTLRGARDRAMISLGYDTLCRGAELVSLRIEDLEACSDGSARIMVRRAKNDQFGYGGWAYISAETLLDVRAWLAAAGLENGPVLRRLFKCRAGCAELRTRTVTLRLRAVAADANLPPAIAQRLTSHSFRVGAVQELAVEGRTIIEIMRAGRWRSVDALAQYLRDTPVNVWSYETEMVGDVAGGPEGDLPPC